MSETMTYFSDRENGEKPRESEEINEQAWGAFDLRSSLWSKTVHSAKVFLRTVKIAVV